ncbi:MAG: glutaredoxin family protein [Cyanobacteriota bacterium]|nr:glutaredoxin family protein [Cyanobacteriota bacterium]
MPSLILYTRVGCCLCEGLEERLRELLPADAVRLVDVDGDPALQARYGLSVPVLALAAAHGAGGSPGTLTLLPPVPPRLKGEPLRAWLHRHAAV